MTTIKKKSKGNYPAHYDTRGWEGKPVPLSIRGTREEQMAAKRAELERELLEVRKKSGRLKDRKQPQPFRSGQEPFKEAMKGKTKGEQMSIMNRRFQQMKALKEREKQQATKFNPLQISQLNL